MNKGIFRMTIDAIKSALKIDNDIDIMGADFEIDRGVVRLLLTTENKSKLFKVAEYSTIPNVEYEDISKDECLYDKILKENITYGEAQDAMSSGQCVARKVWKGYWYQKDITGFAHPVIVAKLRGTGEKVIATPYQEDRFAKDWMIVVPKERPVCIKKETEPNPTESFNITKSNAMVVPIQARAMLKKFENYDIVDISDFLLGLNSSPQWLVYLQVSKFIEIFPFAEGQAPAGRITEKGKTLLNKIREYKLIEN